ncbi:MAG: hypothetical protein HQL30_00870 [Candidatus Omnitrophica bacterium]|nr:hypothetical protein [Candidatus Omnitrophota bacterium]
MGEAKFRRKQYVVLWRFQLKYVMYILLFLYIGAAVAGYTVYWTTWVTLGEKLANVYPQGRLVYIYKQANLTLLFRLALITPIFIVTGIMLSHRIAGPIYRICSYVNELTTGDYSKGIILRKKDELKQIAEKLVALRDSLRKRDEERKKVTGDLIKKLEELKIPDDTIKGIKLDLERIR